MCGRFMLYDQRILHVSHCANPFEKSTIYISETVPCFQTPLGLNSARRIYSQVRNHFVEREKRKKKKQGPGECPVISSILLCFHA